MIEWNIQSRGHHCSRCQKGFTAGGHYHSTLVPDRAGYQRHDFCHACWAGRDGLPDPGSVVSHWTGTYEPPPAAPPEPFRRESAESLLLRLMDLRDERYSPACFILAAMLERKRVLRVKSQIRESGKRYFVYEHTATGDALTILDPNLQLDQLEAVQRDVAALMESGPPESQPVEEPFNASSDLTSLAPA